MTQMGLFEKRKAPKADANEIHLGILARALAGGGWLNAMKLKVLTGLSDRQLRAAANASDGQIISGQKGYRLTREATLEEIDHAAHWLSHQAQAMHRRSIAIQKVRHRHQTGE